MFAEIKIDNLCLHESLLHNYDINFRFSFVLELSDMLYYSNWIALWNLPCFKVTTLNNLKGIKTSFGFTWISPFLFSIDPQILEWHFWIVLADVRKIYHLPSKVSCIQISSTCQCMHINSLLCSKLFTCTSCNTYLHLF